MENIKHTWQFARIGGINRVNLVSGNDLLSLEHLDKKLWTALSCPVVGLEIDSKTLEYIDKDKDGKIRVPEIIEAVRWINFMIKNPDSLIERNQKLPLSEINQENEEGKILYNSALQILENLNKKNESSICVEDTSDTLKIFTNTKFNGDGIICEDSTEDDSLKVLITEILSCKEGTTDRCGKLGINKDIIESFYKECTDYKLWFEKSEKETKIILPFGEKTPEAYSLFNELKLKIDDYFLRCRLADYDAQSTAVLNNTTARFEALSSKILTDSIEDIATFPLALIESSKALPLYKGLNPVWEKHVSKFNSLIVIPMFKEKQFLTEEEWLNINEVFKGHFQWLAEKPEISVESIGIKRIKEILNKNQKEELLHLIEQDLALEVEANNIFMVDKLVRYYRDIFTLLNNFVSFHDFYSSNRKAIFQSGKLYIDQRSCDLCIKVNDMAKHNIIAGLSGICLIYCECTSKVKNEKMTIVAAFTDGDFNDIVVGRNAIFFDNDGLDWDATIIKIIENPISIKQAFWTPYRKFGRFINKQIEKFAADREKEVDSKATTSIEKSVQKADEGLNKSITTESATVQAIPAAAPLAQTQPFDIGKFVGIFAAIGLAIGAIGSVLMAVVSGFLSLTWWKMPIALLGIVLAISGPSMILAWLKLRKRNLAPVLDANGWAINARLTINIIFGKTLTQLASLPFNANLNLKDPFKKTKKSLWISIAIITILLFLTITLLWYFELISLAFITKLF